MSGGQEAYQSCKQPAYGTALTSCLGVGAVQDANSHAVSAEMWEDYHPALNTRLKDLEIAFMHGCVSSHGVPKVHRLK